VSAARKRRGSWHRWRWSGRTEATRRRWRQSGWCRSTGRLIH
jgi:hypothetical protein